MDKKPLVSVIVPNYNYARYLDTRLESVMQQTFTDFELILLDDASTDGSRDILEHYRTDSRVSHLCLNEKNTGNPFKQWMKGIHLARGKYIWIAEADDCAEPEFLDTCVRWAEHTPDVAICYAGSVLFDANGKVEARDVNHWGRRTRKEAACFDGREYATRNLYWKNYIINASGAIFRREYAMNIIDTDFSSMRHCGDWRFWFDLSMQGNVVEVYRKLNYFRQHTGKVTAQSRLHGDGVGEDIRIVAYMEQRLGELPTYKKRLRRGLLYRKIQRMQLDAQEKGRLFDYLYQTLGSSLADHHLERRNQILRLFLPHLTTAKRERL